jgi:hypothetical protein
MLTEQLDGTITLERTNGTAFTLTVPRDVNGKWKMENGEFCIPKSSLPHFSFSIFH